MAPFLAVYFEDASPPGAAAGSPPDDLRLSYGISADGGNTFNRIARIPTNGTKGGVPIARDPSILPRSQAPDGNWHIAVTNHTFDSPLPNDSVDVYAGPYMDAIIPDQQRVDCTALKDPGAPAVQWAWAPEWFRDSDGTIWLIISTSTNVDASLFQFFTWAIPATNAALTTWGAPIKMNGIPFGGIDSYVVKLGSTYYCFTKAGTIQMYRAASFPAGPWTNVLSGSAVTTDAGGAEGPNLTNMGGGRMRCYYDKWDEDGHIKFTDSTDGLATFGAPTYVISRDRMRHCSIIDLAGEPPLKQLAAGGRPLAL